MSMAQAAAPAPAPLPPWLGDPRRTVLQIEVSVVLAAVLLFSQLIFGFLRRQSSHLFIQGALWVAYNVSFTLITYTLGMMQSSPVKSPMYLIWAISLFLVAGCTNSITAYDLDDSKRWKRHFFELCQHIVNLCLISRLAAPAEITVLWAVLAGVTLFTNCLRVIACWMVNFSDPSKVVADYMRDQPDSREAQVPDPIRMIGYKYIVHAGDVLSGDHIITIDNIWERCNDGLFDSNGGSQLKDVCLSFSLFHLLKRRFFGMNCYEAGRPETRDFVLRGLLSENGCDYERAFRIIEVELGFLHDSFFTKYASVYEMEIVFFVYIIPKIILAAMLGLFVYWNPIILETTRPIVKVDTRTIDTAITLVILGALVIVDILQIFLYFASDWALVTLACNYVRNGSCQAARYSLSMTLRRLSLFKYWQNKIGQYSVIESALWDFLELPAQRNTLFTYLMMKLELLFLTTIGKILTCEYCRRKRIVCPVRLPDVVKREIASSLHHCITSSQERSSSNVHLTNGEAALKRNRMFSRFSWTLNGGDRNQTNTMLIWSIATSYCEIVLPQVDDETSPNSVPAEKENREVATKLSRYCAYLMASVPELLPDNAADTTFVLRKVMKEAAAALHAAGIGELTLPDKDKLLEVIKAQESDLENDNTIFLKGLKLGRELDEGIQDSVLRWKVMAEFWAETILYIAPSDNARGHIDQLANGGEFLTHVWALLSHAGILTRPQKQEGDGRVPRRDDPLRRTIYADFGGPCSTPVNSCGSDVPRGQRRIRSRSVGSTRRTI